MYIRQIAFTFIHAVPSLHDAKPNYKNGFTKETCVKVARDWMDDAVIELRWRIPSPA
jgi:hypothetical protein